MQISIAGILASAGTSSGKIDWRLELQHLTLHKVIINKTSPGSRTTIKFKSKLGTLTFVDQLFVSAGSDKQPPPHLERGEQSYSKLCFEIFSQTFLSTHSLKL